MSLAGTDWGFLGYVPRAVVSSVPYLTSDWSISDSWSISLPRDEVLVACELILPRQQGRTGYQGRLEASQGKAHGISSSWFTIHSEDSILSQLNRRLQERMLLGIASFCPLLRSSKLNGLKKGSDQFHE